MTVIREGSSVRVVVDPRGIASTAIDSSGDLIITYTDGTTQDAGNVSSGGGGGGTGPAGPTGPTGATGATGPAGSNGTNGSNGTAATIAVGSTTTLAAGSSATVTNVGTSSAAIFNFGIPQGAAGSGGSGSGTVTSVSVATANGISGTVANATTTPALTLTLGAITPTSVTASGAVSGSNLSGTNTGDQTSVTGNSGTSTKLATARNIAMTGDVSWLVNFDGSAAVTASGTLATVNSNVGSFTYASITVDAKGRVTAASSGAAPGGSGTVTSVSVTTANGVSGTVATATSTPAITIALGAITPSSVAATGVVSGSNLSGTNTGDQTSVTGNAGTATTLATARTINGVSFNGSANITVPAVDTATPRAAITDIVYPCNFSAAGDVYIPAETAMTLALGIVAGTGTPAYAKALASSGPSYSYTTATLPVALAAGDILKVSASAVTGYYVANLKRTA